MKNFFENPNILDREKTAQEAKAKYASEVRSVSKEIYKTLSKHFDQVKKENILYFCKKAQQDAKTNS
ncbi:MAG: hypothetical protein HC913_05655 [Microscillaceae bacterium]|nr:hypothetical protein [Microscillaceae bacterium]